MGRQRVEDSGGTRAGGRGRGVSRGAGAVEVTGLRWDSRDGKPGYLFAAMPGTKMHGASFIDVPR